MHVGLVDASWKGHHTPYIIHLSRYFTGENHQVSFITDPKNPHIDELPKWENFSIITPSLPTFVPDPDENIASSIMEQVVRTRQLRTLLITAQKKDVDVAHIMDFDRTQVPFWRMSRNIGNLPVIVGTLHHDHFTASGNVSFIQGLINATTRYSLSATLADRSMACLTVHSESMRDRIINEIPSANPDNTRTVPAPTPEPTVDASQAEAREFLDLPTDIPILLFFGELRHEKGPDLLIQAIHDLNEPLAVVFAGAADDYTANDVQSWGENIDGIVEIIDRVNFIPEEELDYYFLGADVLVLPYRRTRGISGPLRRACMVGTPVIGNRDSDIGQIIAENELGWAFETATPASLRGAIRAFLRERDAFPTKALFRYAASHHWSESGAKIEAIYKEVITE